MIAEVTATIAIDSAHFIDCSACDRSSAGSRIAISVTTIFVCRADLSDIRASVGNGAQELEKR